MAIASRIKCPKCGNVLNITADQTCTCGTPINYRNEGTIHLYRMGSPLGAAAGYGIHINGEPMGYLANKETIRIPLPYGTYTIHFTCGMTRRCIDGTVTLSPEAPDAYVKGSIQAGFWSNTLHVTVVSAADFPKED